MDWLDLLAVQVTPKSLLQQHSSKASILQHLAFFIVQLSHPYMTTGKTIALTRRTFVGKVMSLLFNMLSRLVIAFPPRSKCLLISRLHSPSAVIWSPPKIKTVACRASLSMGFSRQEYRSGLPFPPQGDIPNPGIKPSSLQNGNTGLINYAKNSENILFLSLLRMKLCRRQMKKL